LRNGTAERVTTPVEQEQHKADLDMSDEKSRAKDAVEGEGREQPIWGKRGGEDGSR